MYAIRSYYGAESDIAHREFVKAQEAADEQHKVFINAQKEIRDLDKEIFKLKKKDKDGKSRVVKSELQKDAKSVITSYSIHYTKLYESTLPTLMPCRAKVLSILMRKLSAR